MSFRHLKTAIAGVALALLTNLSAFAGDTSTLNVLGFSEDGTIFAFEEYGVQDGSGFPYANRFYIDTATDEFISGSPVRVRIDDENASVEDVRAQAKSQSEAIIADAALKAAFPAAINTVTEMSSDRHRIAALPRPVFPAFDEVLEFRLTEIPFTPSSNCGGIQQESTGFRLVQIATKPGESAKLLHEDSSVPDSRACPNGYFLGGIYTYFANNSDPIFAVIIGVESFGFEGPDYRWMAVTGQNSTAAAK